MFNFDFTLNKYEELCQMMLSSEYVHRVMDAKK